MSEKTYKEHQRLYYHDGHWIKDQSAVEDTCSDDSSLHLSDMDSDDSNEYPHISNESAEDFIRDSNEDNTSDRTG